VFVEICANFPYLSHFDNSLIALNALYKFYRSSYKKQDELRNNVGQPLYGKVRKQAILDSKTIYYGDQQKY
jgi:hypothetical protein